MYIILYIYANTSRQVYIRTQTLYSIGSEVKQFFIVFRVSFFITVKQQSGENIPFIAPAWFNLKRRPRPRNVRYRHRKFFIIITIIILRNVQWNYKTYTHRRRHMVMSLNAFWATFLDNNNLENPSQNGFIFSVYRQPLIGLT